jgi:hypothetical protein
LPPSLAPTPLHRTTSTGLTAPHAPACPENGLPGPFACPQRPGAPPGAAATAMAASPT